MTPQTELFDSWKMKGVFSGSKKVRCDEFFLSLVAIKQKKVVAVAFFVYKIRPFQEGEPYLSMCGHDTKYYVCMYLIRK